MSKLNQEMELSLPNKGETAEATKMKRCRMCGKLKNEPDGDGLYCGRCEHVQADQMADLQSELCV